MRQALILGCKDPIVEELRRFLVDDFNVIVKHSLFEPFLDNKLAHIDCIFVALEALEIEKSSLGDQCYRASLQILWKSFADTKVIVLAEKSQMRAVVRTVLAGADDYLTLPLTYPELDLVLKRANDQELQAAQIKHFDSMAQNKAIYNSIPTNSLKMIEVLKKVNSVADKTVNVLLTGETGVGKGVVARLIHENSRRKNKPFISVHCGAIPETLLESELFGFEKGAFTGADRRKLGRFELANGGTIFLDEIGTISPSAQIKLLQVLQESKFQRVGGQEDIKVDIRVVAATNENLLELVERGQFRKDLFYRLNVFPILIPPLRERLEDVLNLAESFLTRFSQIHQKEIFGISAKVGEALKKYHWPGNIRELENVVERACILEVNHKLELSSFPPEIAGNNLEAVVPVEADLPLAEARNYMIEEFEKKYLSELLQKHHGKIKEVASSAGVSARQIHKLLVKYGLDGKEFRTKEKSANNLEGAQKNENSKFIH